MKSQVYSFIDLEGVLVPEMWPHLAMQFGILELAATTREVPDYQHLMDQRIAAISRHGITISEICSAVSMLTPFDGAREFLQALKERGRVAIVSDSFRPMNLHFLDTLPVDLVLCHDFRVGSDGSILGFDYWNGLGGKHLCFEAVKLDGYRTFAMGDALNDLSMLRAASTGVLFCASPVTRKAAPDLRVAANYADALAALDSQVPRSTIR